MSRKGIVFAERRGKTLSFCPGSKRIFCGKTLGHQECARSSFRLKIGRSLAQCTKYQGLIRIWYDREISPGADYDAVIKAHLDSAQLVILLMSPDFLASD